MVTDHSTPEDYNSTLIEHLASFGIRHFSDEAYWNWGAETLGPKLVRKLNRLREPILDGTADSAHMQRFYDFSAAPRIASVVHSMKADAIKQSGLFVLRRLPSEGMFLDVGCSIGYLTMFYALDSPKRQVIGWDISKKSVNVARMQANKLNVSNVEFLCRDIASDSEDGVFDAVCSTQTVGDRSLYITALRQVSICLKPSGVFLSVEAIPNAREAKSYLENAAEEQLGLTHFEFVRFSDLGASGAYPSFVLVKGAKPISVDMDDSYRKVLKWLGR